ncbi:mitofilin family membrane protein [Kaistia dalseonensis]|uniref:Mitochondrial inner membrane protein n=1 Tax=Kaistia dalseonensis TaxID=410840 RepID=A0ABU0H4S5_9HYPH|nr:mitofilin family membrane protein [Kaistia dalseonensis]MCX5494716.1 mitofilin family membrane protein [Kaistia dalseonensis]MDQ0437297.1 hypothetical protein [Kaistia dalseonensis]
MADEDIFNPATGDTTGQRRKRPPVTIDLEAEPDDNTAPPIIEPVAEEPAAPVPPSEDPEVDLPPPPRQEEPPRQEAAPRQSGMGSLVQIAGAAIGGGVIGGLLTAFLMAPGTDTVTQASIDSRFATIASRLDGLEAGIAARTTETPAPIDTGRLDAIDQQIAGLKTAFDNLPKGTSEPAAPADLAPIEQRLAALEARPEAAPQAPPIDLTPLQANVEQLAARIDQIEQHPPVDPRTEAAARTIALTTLRQAATAGGPFENELAALKTLGVEDAALAPLAAGGAPSRSALVAAFPAIADQIRAASMKVDPNAGIFDRLAASAGSLVSVKPAGPVAGSTTTAIVSRMEAAVSAGDLAAALQEAEGLDSVARAPLAEWADAARKRVAIDAALKQLDASGPAN